MIEVTIYQRPDGRKLRTLISSVDSDDESFFKYQGIIIGIEELEDNQYAVRGRHPDAHEEDEVTVLSNGQTCNECLKELRRGLESARGK